PPLGPTLFPYTTLFRSGVLTVGTVVAWQRVAGSAGARGAVAGLTLLAGALGAGAFTMALYFHGSIEAVAESPADVAARTQGLLRSEEHTSELQSPCNLV